MLGPVESSELDIMSTYVVRVGTHKTNTDEPKKKPTIRVVAPYGVCGH